MSDTPRPFYAIEVCPIPESFYEALRDMGMRREAIAAWWLNRCIKIVQNEDGRTHKSPGP